VTQIKSQEQIPESVSEETVEKLETIIEMRKPSGPIGHPKHTQEEVAEELGITQPAVSQLESKYLEEPNGNIMETQEENEQNEGVTENETIEEEKEVNENNNQSQETADKWVCTNCGNNEYYEANQYLKSYKSRLNDTQVQVVAEGDKVCANCGTVE
jgi:predicted transcriptional regulator